MLPGRSLVIAFSLMCPLAAVAQQAPAVRSYASLRTEVPRIATDTGLQLRIRWRTDAPVADPTETASHFDLISLQAVDVPVRPDRAPQISSATLILVAVDAAGQEVDWRVVRDPRIVRSELTGEDTLKSEQLYYLDISFTIVLPDTPGLTGLRVYSVRSRSGELVIVPLGFLTLRGAK
jgi:hypothetical protein